jgi:hypothetical protein
MNVSTTVNKPEPVLKHPADLPLGTVYSWGNKSASYLRVYEGCVCLSNWDFIPLSHAHFSKAQGPRVQVADKADLTITYEG